MTNTDDCCPECGASLAECHIGDAACPECGRVCGDGGVVVSDDIRPRIVDGVGRCTYDCPMAITSWNPMASFVCCVTEDSVHMTDGEVCPHHARRVAAERDRLRDAIRTALEESTTYDEVEARLIGLVEEE